MTQKKTFKEKKLYEVIIGYREKNGDESFNIDSFTVIAKDALEVLAGDGGDYYLKEEKKLMKQKITPFIQEIKFISKIDYK